MKKSTLFNGSITFTLPDTASDVKEIQTSSTLRQRKGGAQQEPTEISRILAALMEDEPVAPEEHAHMVNGFTVDVGEVKPLQVSRSTKPESMDVEVELTPDESAVILIEKDGAYEWHFPEKLAQITQRQRRGFTNVINSKTAHFSIPIGDPLPVAPGRRSRSLSGAITNFIKEKVTGFVLKFIVRSAIGPLTRLLEKGVQEGPIVISSATNVNDWQRVTDFSGVTLPQDRPAKILFFIHGTFSSTAGSFGALTEYKEGQKFLALALKQYDAVLAYDHHTLAATPNENAEAIFQKLDQLQKLANVGLVIDAISFSRGGLVYRYLTEQIAPTERRPLLFNKAIFVGCTNSGTELANHKNWKMLVDFYTTMIACASRLLALHPASRVAGLILNQSVKIIGSLVKYIAQDAVANNAVPGLAAMRPDGDFIKLLNTVSGNRTRPGARSYYAIGSDFEPVTDAPLGERIALLAADKIVDRLMGQKNDLVVNQSSMFVIDPIPAAVLSGKLPFDHNSAIYHTVYFHQPSVSEKCIEWLELLSAGRVSNQDFPRDWWAAEVVRDFTILPATTSIDEASRILENNASHFVVLERLHAGNLLHYGIPRTILQNRLKTITRRSDTLMESLDMREIDSHDVTMEQVLTSENADDFRNRTAEKTSRLPGGVTHAVISGDTGPIGVATRPTIVTAREMGEAAARARRVRRTITNVIDDVNIEPVGTLVTPLEVWCYANAIMAEEAPINRKAAIEVTISRDEIIFIAGAAAAGAGGKVHTDKDLIVEVQARKHCIVSGESRVEIAVPTRGNDHLLYFDIIPKHEGAGEVRVIVRQGNQVIANLKLFPKFVATASNDVVNMTSAKAELIPTQERREINNVLYIREAQMGNAHVLDFELEFEINGQKQRIRERSQPFSNNEVKLNFINGLYKDIEEFWAKSSDDYDAFILGLQASGAAIFKQLIPRQLRKALWDNRDQLNSIQVFSDEPFIPWELTYLTNSDGIISPNSCFLAEKGMVRGYSNPDGLTRMPPSKIKMRKDMAKYVIPDYPDGSGFALPGAQAEKEMLKRIFNATPITPNKIDVIKQLQVGEFDLLHFACHGISEPDRIWDSSLLMQGKMQGAYKQDKLTASEVESYTNLISGDSTPLVMLNACQVGRTGYSLTNTGGFAQAFMQAGAGAFIGTHWSIGDDSGLIFSTVLYKELNAEKDMVTALKAAREAAKNGSELSWLAYVAYADPYAKLQH